MGMWVFHVVGFSDWLKMQIFVYNFCLYPVRNCGIYTCYLGPCLYTPLLTTSKRIYYIVPDCESVRKKNLKLSIYSHLAEKASGLLGPQRL